MQDTTKVICDFKVRIERIRRVSPFGGAIAVATDLSNDHQVTLILNYKCIPDGSQLHPLQLWKGRGTYLERDVNHGQRVVRELHLIAEEAWLFNSLGDNVRNFLLKNVAGIGEQKVQALEEFAVRLSLSLEDIIKSRNFDLLKGVIPEKSIVSLSDQIAASESLLCQFWLDKVNLPPRYAKRVFDYWGAEVKEKIKENPFYLLAFGAKWALVDTLAKEHFEVNEDDPRRLRAAIEESLTRLLKDGSTVATESEVRTRLKSVISDSKPLLDRALEQQVNGTDFLINNGLYHLTGAWLVERRIAMAIKEMTGAEPEPTQLTLSTDVCLDSCITDYEQKYGLELSDAQRSAVEMVLSNKFSLIIGGAGTGKTTVLTCIFSCLRELEPTTAIYQIALAGKAAKRMTEVTGRPAQTIASFCKQAKEKNLPSGAMVVIDEVSMVDIQSMHRILRALPPNCRLVLVGDDAQLPPVGPGLLLHCLVGLDSIPQTRLTVVKRQSDTTGIPQVATKIRVGEQPVIPLSRVDDVKPQVGVQFVACKAQSLNDTVIDIFGRLGGHSGEEVQILSPTRTGAGGCEDVNNGCQIRYNESTEYVSFRSSEQLEHGALKYITTKGGSLKQGDPVIFGWNDYERDLRNGSVGRIVACYHPNDPADPVCSIEWDTGFVDMFYDDLPWIEKAYAITAHKSQGSQYNRVIIPIRKSRILDRSLIYTAITRAITQVVIVGDERELQSTIERVSADNRRVHLDVMLSNSFK